jgi:hypothetical protein
MSNYVINAMDLGEPIFDVVHQHQQQQDKDKDKDKDKRQKQR